MKLDFLFGGAGGGGGSAGEPVAKILIPRADPVPPPLDDASRVIRMGLIVAGAIFGLFVVFALFAPISGAAVATGEVTTAGTRIVIQPQAGGVVDKLFVGEGQLVRAGQPLVRLNGVRSAAAAQQAQARRDALRATQARLMAERDGAEALAFPQDLMQRAGDPVAASAMASQRAIFDRRRAVMLADREIQGTANGSAQAQQTSKQRQLALIRDELAMFRKLYRQGYARLTQVRALERSEAQLVADSIVAQGESAKARLQSARLADSQMMEIVSQLSQIEEQLAQADPALRVRQYDADRDLMRAPVAGRVSGVARVGSGTVVGTGSTMMEIVPTGRSLIVEAQIKPTDIDDVRTGSPATLRFSTVNPHGKSSFEGKVVALSPAPMSGQNGQGYFRAQIAVDNPAELEKAGVALQPGVPVTVHVKTRSRTLFDYLFSPIADAFSGGFREE